MSDLSYVGPTLHHPTSDLPYIRPILCQTYPTLPYVRPTLCCPMSDLSYIALHWTYPTPPYIRPTLHRTYPTSDPPYVTLCQTTLRWTYPTTLHQTYLTSDLPYVRPTLRCPTPDLFYASDLPYAALHLLNSEFLVCPVSASYLWLWPSLHPCWTLRCMRGSFLGWFLTVPWQCR